MSKMYIYVLIFVLIAVVGFYFFYGDRETISNEVVTRDSVKTEVGGNELLNDLELEKLPNISMAVFSGGCFWCTESEYDSVDGVIDVVSGFTGGEEVDPTYKQVSTGQTGHKEGVIITYDSSVISYEELLDIYWRHIDPTDETGSFIDRGFQYTSGIFYFDEDQKKKAEFSRVELDESGIYDKKIVTPIIMFDKFYPAEDYHQDYHEKNPIRYAFYRSGSGRDIYINSIWGDMTVREKLESLGKSKRSDVVKRDVIEGGSGFTMPSDAELKEMLTDIQYKVTQRDGTERAFSNEYWDNKEEGIYVDIISGEALFSSTDKYKSGTGWPSFTKPLDNDNLVLRDDKGFFFTRTELRSKNADSHLGHLFDDGPLPSGDRYCINSAAMRFVPKGYMESEGYSEYLYLFE